MKDCFMNGTPPGAKGVAAKSGYMNTESFANESLPFFINQSNCTPDKPVGLLLILDNHTSHVSIKAVDVCRSAGIVLLTLPPHTSHRLQPLNRRVFEPMKCYFNKAIDNWIRTNPGRRASIYEVGGTAGSAFNLSMTSSNILSAFRCTGIYPLDTHVFGDHEFESAMVTDRPDSQEDCVDEDVQQTASTSTHNDTLVNAISADTGTPAKDHLSTDESLD